jgi:metal-sulfur cluster biosynthetic enzyme
MTLLGKLGELLGVEAAPEDIGIAPEDALPGSAAEQAREALRQVIDPELGINIVDLGLVCGILLDDERVSVALTMTTPACPLGGLIKSHARAALQDVFPEREIEVRLVWDPPWTSDRMSRAARQMLGFGDQTTNEES